ncbi:hypothetical protein ANN_22398 [Periplaneta americana]|uniref:Uncharacterized protein n=1 Tax=Periplaneta americana TaxID=6978 RepID=A0ABQ8S8A6_PERAM|nr:hypothetical protein ANN_22398 [Periplaneta americana]
MFPPNTWNCYIRTRENLPRTTNTCEAWHRRLNTLMGKAHPYFYHDLKLLQEETARIHQDIEELEAGQSPPRKKKKYTSLDNRIARIVNMKRIEHEITSLITYVR